MVLDAAAEANADATPITWPELPRGSFAFELATLSPLELCTFSNTWPDSWFTTCVSGRPLPSRTSTYIIIIHIQ